MNKNKIKISVIIPVYNTAQYLRKCLDSIVVQTLKDIEIICVNDGSTDESLTILEEYKKKDSRIVVINQDNKGQSSARNAGIKVAQGEYIGFADSDDFVEANMYERLYSNAIINHSDVTMCSIKVLEPNGSYREDDPYFSLDIFDKSFDNKVFSYLDCKDFLFRICVSPCNKIYNRKFLETNNISYIESLNFEDNVFMLDVLIKAKKISLIRDALTIYRRASNTSLTTHDDSKKLDLFRVVDEQENLLLKNHNYQILNNYFNQHKRHTLAYWYNKIKDKTVKAEYEKLLSEVTYNNF